jgi:hypothetical protein
VLEGVPNPTQVTHHVVANGGHFSFLSPFPPTMQQPGFLPATDPPGFNRTAFHEQLPVMIAQFLELHFAQT